MPGIVAGRVAGMLAVALLTAVTMAPAAWLGDLLEGKGPLRLVHASGTLWHGSSFLAVSDGRRAHVVPGRVVWRVKLSEILSGRLTVILEHEAVEGTVGVSFTGRAVDIQGGKMRLPAGLLAVLGAPFNTVRPGGRLLVQWDNIRLGRDGFEGNVQLDWEDAQSALSIVAPLGSFRLTASGRGTLGEANLVTMKGPLLLQGRGYMDEGGIRFSGTANAQPEMRASLDGLIGLLGQRMGDQVLLEWEIRH